MARLKHVAWLLPVALLLVGGGYGIAHHQPDRTVEELAARWAQPPSRFLAVGGLDVHLRDVGPRDDPVPVVLLHGTSSSLHTWEGWTAELAGERRVIAFDLPGFGLTGPRPDDDYRIEAYVAFVVDVLDALGVERCVLGGNSLGGQIAWATALAHPDRVARLVLVDSAGYALAPTSVPLGFRLARAPVIRELVREVLPRSVVRSSVENVFGDPSRVSENLVDRYFDLTLRAGNREALMHRMRQLEPGVGSDRIGRITQPTLILWGARDRLIPLAAGERFARDIPNSELVVWDDLGHVPQEEDPARTVRPVLTFLQDEDGA